jgi:hypothetical protein
VSLALDMAIKENNIYQQFTNFNRVAVRLQ